MHIKSCNKPKLLLFKIVLYIGPLIQQGLLAKAWTNVIYRVDYVRLCKNIYLIKSYSRFWEALPKKHVLRFSLSELKTESSGIKKTKRFQ